IRFCRAMIGSCRISMDWIMRGASTWVWLIRCDMLVSSRIATAPHIQGKRKEGTAGKAVRSFYFLISFSFFRRSKSSPPFQGIREHLAVGELQYRTGRQPAGEAGPPPPPPRPPGGEGEGGVVAPHPGVCWPHDL